MLVVASKPGVYALERAANFGVEVRRGQPARSYADSAAFDAAAAGHPAAATTLTWWCWPGFLRVLGAKRHCRLSATSIINVHPSLIPSFCGPGFYGLRVHEAALARGVKVTGATVHLVNEECDGGPILLQKAVAVQPGDTPEVLQKRVMVRSRVEAAAPGAGHGVQATEVVNNEERICTNIWPVTNIPAAALCWA